MFLTMMNCLRRIKEKDRGREDDKGDTPQKRINEYNLKLPELLNFFEKKDIPVAEFNAIGDIDEVFENISWELKFASYKLK
jgi:adenylate kinase family enzyme